MHKINPMNERKERSESSEGGKKAMDVLHSRDSLENQESVRFNIFTAAQLSIQSFKKHCCVTGRVVPDVPRVGQAVNKMGA
jgi:hypothetical protein